MISLLQDNNQIKLSLQFQIYNTSTSHFNLDKLKLAIISQLSRVYNGSFGKYNLKIICNVEIIKHKIGISPRKILIQIVDEINGNNPAEADLGGLRIKLNKNIIDNIISEVNIRTIPHELGHLFGWNHPHANALFQSINPNASELEKLLTEVERCCNLMSQTWYAQKANVLLENAMCITENQVELLVQNFKNDVLNKNYHLKHFLFWKHLY